MKSEACLRRSRPDARRSITSSLSRNWCSQSTSAAAYWSCSAVSVPPQSELCCSFEFDSQQLGKVLQTVSIGISADELGSDFCAVNRSAHHAQPTAQHADIEAGEMKQLVTRR